jgi:hypothetical protein
MAWTKDVFALSLVRFDRCAAPVAVVKDQNFARALHFTSDPQQRTAAPPHYVASDNDP